MLRASKIMETIIKENETWTIIKMPLLKMFELHWEDEFGSSLVAIKRTKKECLKIINN